ncbi:hypothetical protein CJ467_13870 [Bacillus velezensis]|uniref:Uncharacterized protein n=1 Tax=Bacillus velezensis TaxID=492670 RepID=A0ABC8DCF6_BACVE|nr:hypothetical protein SB24_14150 [Bacillus sp. Pc3]AMQ71387.1 hypothetical protein BAMY6639_06525 [Bacillus amyloliquefaciens UMAF6639]AMR51560.1 hypothetical protein A1R12_14820 [Bacillus amyloliquefaciens]ANB48355.1 hypothetical protein A1D33_013695 [Bacillus velezensis]AVI29965.1 hypothetical protein C3Z10_16990 [Bacillus velezensis]
MTSAENRPAASFLKKVAAAANMGTNSNLFFPECFLILPDSMVICRHVRFSKKFYISFHKIPPIS